MSASKARRELRRPSPPTAYAAAVVVMLLALALVTLLSHLSGYTHFGPLVGTVAIVTLFLGPRPALLATAVGWAATLVLWVVGMWSGLATTAGVIEWLIPLLVALVVIGVGGHLLSRDRRSTERIALARRESTTAAELHELSAALSAAAGPTEVARSLVLHVPGLLGAVGASLGLIEDDDLVIVDPAGAPLATLTPGLRLPLDTRAPICVAARTGLPTAVDDRATFERDYPYGAALATYAAGALAVPLLVDGRVAGAMGFPFAEPGAIDDRVVSLAQVAARLGGQAFERAALLDTERRARVRAERLAGDLAQLHTLGSALAAAAAPVDVAELVSERLVVAGGAVGAGLYTYGPDGPGELLASAGAMGEPAAHDDGLPLEPGWRAHVAYAVAVRMPVWVESDEDWARYPGCEELRRQGIAASVVVPLLGEDGPTGVLYALFDTSPGESGRRLVETMGGQAGPPLERARVHEQERDARLDAELAASRTRTLQNLAEKLTAAATPSDVGDVVVHKMTSVLGADGVLVYVLDDDRRVIRLLSHAGFGDDVRRSVIAVDAGHPVADVIANGRPVTIATPPSAAASAGDVQSAFCHPLAAGGRVLGAVYFVYRSPATLDPLSESLARTVFRQAAVALDRSLRFEDELASRRRSERLQVLTADLSRALTSAEVATTYLAATRAVLGTDVSLVGTIDAEQTELTVIAAYGLDGHAPGQRSPIVLGPRRPDVLAPGRRRPVTLGRDELATAYPELAAAVGVQGLAACSVTPLRAGKAAIGLVLHGWRAAPQLGPADRAFLETTSSQCAVALDRALRYEGERQIAETLQRSVLPDTVPTMPGARVAAVYLPGSTALDVGGDWFDTLTLPDGRLGFVVGDVVGKGVRAAATMAQLRNGLRALALDSAPGEAVTKLNRLVEHYADIPFATLVYATVDPASLDVTIASAGHPPPLVVDPDGEARFLEVAGGLPLGADADTCYEGWQTTLTPGATLVLYTDGLVERPQRPIDEGLELLAAAAGSAPRGPQALADAIVAELLGDAARRDDVALLVVTLEPALLAPLRLTVPATPEALPELRTTLERWLAGVAVPPADAREIVLAAWEAGANAVEHSGAGDEAVVLLDASLADDRVRVEVADSGRWRVPRPRPERGLGLKLINALMESVDVDSDERGTRVVMSRRLDGRERVDGLG